MKRHRFALIIAVRQLGREIRRAIALIFRSTEGDLKGRLTTLKFL
ncbi:MAG: hypothetical protein V7L29_19165 [Nostoc sp.]